MGFLSRLCIAVIFTIATTLVLAIGFDRLVTPTGFYGAICAAVATSYVLDPVIEWLERRRMRGILSRVR